MSRALSVRGNANYRSPNAVADVLLNFVYLAYIGPTVQGLFVWRGLWRVISGRRPFGNGTFRMVDRSNPSAWR